MHVKCLSRFSLCSEGEKGVDSHLVLHTRAKWEELSDLVMPDYKFWKRREPHVICNGSLICFELQYCRDPIWKKSCRLKANWYLDVLATCHFSLLEAFLILEGLMPKILELGFLGNPTGRGKVESLGGFLESLIRWVVYLVELDAKTPKRSYSALIPNCSVWIMWDLKPPCYLFYSFYVLLCLGINKERKNINRPFINFSRVGNLNKMLSVVWLACQ